MSYTTKSLHGNKALPLMVVGLVSGCVSLASAGFVYDEAIDGDLAHPDFAVVLPFSAGGVNTISLTVDLFSDGFIIDIGAGQTLESFTMTAFNVNIGASATFHLIAGPDNIEGNSLTTPFASFDGSLMGVDLISHFGSGPQGEGQYLFNFWHDNTADPTMTFDIRIVPAPSALALLGFAGVAGCRRRR